MKVADMLDAYQHHLSEGSPRTVAAFAPAAKAIRDRLGERDHLEVTPAELRTAILEATAGYKERTRFMWTSFIRACWRYPEKGLGEPPDPRNPVRINGLGLGPVPKPKSRPYLAPDLVDAICQAPRTRRPRLMLNILRVTGLRISELLNLEVRDVQDAEAGTGDGRRLIIRTPKSGQDEEAVALTAALADDLKAYLQCAGLSGTARLFPTTAAALRDVVKRAGKRYGVDLSPHDLRRAWASRKARAGVPIAVIQAGLRQKSESTTRGYISPIGFSELMAMQDQTEGIAPVVHTAMVALTGKG